LECCIDKAHIVTIADLSFYLKFFVFFAKIKVMNNLNYKNMSWNIRLDDFPEQAKIEEQIRFILSLAILAPSTHNSQPWLFRLKENVCDVYADMKIKLPESDKTGRDLFISLGCLAEHINQVGRYYGLIPEIHFLNNLPPEPIFKVTFIRGSRELDFKSHIEAILTRINVRGLFDRKDVAPELLEHLSAKFSDSVVGVNILAGYEKTKIFGKITARAIAEAHLNKNFRIELSQWMRHSLTKKLTGLVGYNLRIPFILSFIFPPLIKRMNLGKVFAQLNYRAIASASAVGILTTTEDSHLAWWEVGRKFQALNLYLNSQGIRTSIYVGSIEIGNNRQSVQQLINTTKLPQFSFVFGYMKGNFKHSPRQPLALKILHD